jgi:hypothetical protein
MKDVGFSLILLLLVSCSRNSEIGCWRIKSTELMGIYMPADQPGDYCFNENGSMQFRFKGEVERTGTYTRSDDGKTIVLTFSDGLVETMSNIEISGSEMKAEGSNFRMRLERQ